MQKQIYLKLEMEYLKLESDVGGHTYIYPLIKSFYSTPFKK